MKKFRTKYQAFSQKAAQVKQALETAPAKVAEIRQTIAETAHQFQQFKKEVLSGVTAWQANTEDKLLLTLAEINESAGVLLKAGYILNGVELELGPNQRLIVHLDKVEETEKQTQVLLLAQNQNKPVIRGILEALIKAQELDDIVSLSGLTQRELIVEAGLLPSVRLCWWADTQTAEDEEQPPPVPIVSTASAPAAVSQPSSLLGAGPFFERRPSTPVPAGGTKAAEKPEEPAESTPAPTTSVRQKETPGRTSSSSSSGDWRRDALERFKKMPDLSKHSG